MSSHERGETQEEDREQRFGLVIHHSHHWLSAERLSQTVGCSVDLVFAFERHGVLEPIRHERGEPCFGQECVERLGRALRLRRDLGISVRSLGLVLDLLDRVAELEAEVTRLGGARTRPDEAPFDAE